MDVAAWLQGLGLERYLPAFRDNEIDWDALSKLSAEDLKDLGVVLGGHRRRLLDAIAALGAAAPAASATAAPRDAPALAEADPATPADAPRTIKGTRRSVPLRRRQRSR
jgi:hypothetical protein